MSKIASRRLFQKRELATKHKLRHYLQTATKSLYIHINTQRHTPKTSATKATLDCTSTHNCWSLTSSQVQHLHLKWYRKQSVVSPAWNLTYGELKPMGHKVSEQVSRGAAPLLVLRTGQYFFSSMLIAGKKPEGSHRSHIPYPSYPFAY